MDMPDAPAPKLASHFQAPRAAPAPFDRPPAPAPAPTPPPAPAPTPPPVPTPPAAAPAPGEEAPAHAFTFGKRDPTDKAKRLARVLVSDMIMYNAERHQTALENGTLVEDFEDEIEKSWKEFVEQVGDDLANGPGRGFWKEALNDILAKGNQVF
jgi:hypothetical protein